jgi:protein-S-isoprenylcysteine O-methyltransferase Ste14
MNEILDRLKKIYWSMIVLLVGLVLLIEFFFMDLMGGAAISDDANLEFFFQSLATLLSLGGLFLALRYFKMGTIERQLLDDPLSKYQPFSIVRLIILELIVHIDLFGYLLFVNSFFLWLSLIVATGFFVVYPSKERFLSETGYAEK